jgi:hypothetical protein
MGGGTAMDHGRAQADWCNAPLVLYYCKVSCQRIKALVNIHMLEMQLNARRVE